MVLHNLRRVPAIASAPGWTLATQIYFDRQKIGERTKFTDVYSRKHR
jgi:hypothetical protein